MFSKVSTFQSSSTASAHAFPKDNGIKKSEPEKMQVDGGTGHPFLLTRIYEGKRPFELMDQDSLSRTFKPLIRINPITISNLKLSDLEKVGEPLNRNGLGIFVDPSTGEKYYIKKSPDAGKARNEALCATLASRFGVNVPQVQVLHEDGKHYVASTFMDGLELANERYPNCAIDPAELVKIPVECPDIQKAFVAAVLLNNRDILGMGLDNVGFTTKPDGSLVSHFVDFGGSAEYRATAGKKTFDGKALEFASMTEPQLQADSSGGGPSGLVFGSTPKATLQKSLDAVFAMTDSELKTEIAKQIPDIAQGEQFFKTLMLRRDAIQAQLNAGNHDRFEEKQQVAINYGITLSYAWDDEIEAINAHLKRKFGPEISAYCEKNRHLMADGTGQIEISEKVQSIVAAELNALLVDLHGERSTQAEWKKRLQAAN